MRRYLYIAASLALAAAFALAFNVPASAATICNIFNGCTGTSTAPAYGQILIGGKNGEYELVASSTFGGGGGGGGSGFSTTSAAYWLTQQSTSNLVEGSNLYFTNARAISALTGQSNSIFTNGAGYLTSLAGAASSTVLSDNNTFSGVDTFTNASSNFGGTWQGFSSSHFQVAGTYVTSIGATWPILSSGGTSPTLSWGGLSTTSNLVTSQLVYASGVGSLTSVATSTLTPSSPLTGSFIQIGSSGSLAIQAASASQNGYESSGSYALIHTATTTFSAPLSYSNSTNAVTCPTCSTATAANPSGTVGLTAVNGSASTFIRSDAAPALSQSITPTWTGLHIFQVGLIAQASSTVGNNTQGGGLTVNGGATTTGSAYIAGTLGVSTTTSLTGNTLEIQGNLGLDRSDTGQNVFTITPSSNGTNFNTQNSNGNQIFAISGTEIFRIRNTGMDVGNNGGTTPPANGLYVQGSIGVATTTFGTLLNLAGVANFGTATSTFYSSGGINLEAGCFAINGTCITGGGSSASSTLLGDNNTFTGKDIFSNATTTLLTATTEWLPSLGTPAGTFLAVDPNGKIIATSTPAVGGGGTVTSVAANNGITGGTITTSGTLSLVSYIATSSLETGGQIPYWTTTSGNPAKLGSVATSSLGVTGPITFSGTLFAQIGGAGGNFGCSTASSGVTGCLAGADWTTFNNKISSSSLSASLPLTYNSGTGAFSSLFSTTTNTGIGNNLFLYTSNSGVIVGAASSSLNLPNAALQNSSTSFTSGDSSLTVPASINLGSSGSFVLNLGHSNVWTASTTFQQQLNLQGASTTLLSTGTFWNTGITSALGLFDANHKETAYAGSSNPCAANQAPTTISAVGAEGGCTSTFLTGNQTVTLSGDVTGSGATAITTAFNLANSHWWTATQNFTNASTSELTATSSIWFTGITASRLLAVDNNGMLVASTSIGTNLLAANGVSAGSCTNCNLTIAANGIVTAQSNGSAGGGGGGNVATSSVPVVGGLAYWTTTTATPALLSTTATTTLAGGGPITVSNSPVVIGSSGAVLGCTSASNGVTGCMTATDWGYLHTATTTFSAPLSYSNSTNAVTCPTCNTSSLSGSGVNGMMTAWSGTNSLIATSTILGAYFIATSTTATTSITGPMNIGTTTSSVGAGLNIAAQHVRFGFATSSYPFNYAPSCVTCEYLGIDKGATTDDSSIVFRDQGNARAEIGIIGSDDFQIKSVSGTYPTESFTTMLDMSAATRNIGIATTAPSTLFSIGTNNNFTVDYSGDASTSGTFTVDGSFNGQSQAGTGNGKITDKGHEASGQGAYMAFADDVLGNVGYFGQNSVINGGTAYGQFDFQSPQATGSLCFSGGGRSSATGGANCDLLDTAAGYWTISTSTPGWGFLTIASSTAPQISLSDGVAADPEWSLRNVSGNFYLASSTASATSTNAALAIFTNAPPSLSVGTTTSTENDGIENLGLDPTSGAATSTIVLTGKIAIQGLNAQGAIVCLFVTGSLATTTPGACTP